MLHGNIYPAGQVPGALTGFFRTDHLAALRDLALRFLADQTGAELSAQLARHERPGSERILAGVTPAPGGDAIVRRAAQLAARHPAGEGSITGSLTEIKTLMTRRMDGRP